MKKILVTVAIAGSMALSLCAYAQKGAVYQAPPPEPVSDWTTGWYIGAGVNGNAEATMNLNGSPEVFFHDLGMFQETEMSSAALGFDAYIGRQINKFWGAELGYTMVGETDFDFETLEKESVEGEVNQWNAHLVAVGRLPIGHYVNFFLKGGIAFFSSTQEFEDANLSDKNTFTEKQDTTNTWALTYGAGAELTWENWGVRGEYNVIYPANNVRDDFYIADVISANIYYQFN